MKSRLWFVVLLCLPVLLSAQERVRKPWYIGFGVGTFFDAAWEFDGDELTWDDFYEGASSVSPKIAFNFKVGGTLSPYALLGFDLTAITQEGEDLGVKVSTRITNLFLMLTLFPFQEGLFLRFGGGFSNHQMDIDIYGLGSGSDEYNGYGALIGVGYAFWLGERFNLTLNLDYTRQFYSDADAPDNTRFTMLYIGFDWY